MASNIFTVTSTEHYACLSGISDRCASHHCTEVGDGGRVSEQTGWRFVLIDDYVAENNKVDGPVGYLSVMMVAAVNVEVADKNIDNDDD